MQVGTPGHRARFDVPPVLPIPSPCYFGESRSLCEGCGIVSGWMHPIPLGWDIVPLRLLPTIARMLSHEPGPTRGAAAAVPINHNGGETTFILQVTCSLGARVDIVCCVRVFACGYACARPPREQRTITVWMPSLLSTTTKRSPCASYSYTARATPASPRLLRTKSARAYNSVLRRMAVAPCRTRTQRVMASEPSHVRDSLQPLL